MSQPVAGATDCDVHVPPPPVSALLPWLDAYWAEQVTARNIDRAPFTLTSYPAQAPYSCREDWRAPGGGLPWLRERLLDRFGLGLAVCSVLHGAVTLHNQDMAAALCAAVNDWLAAEWLAKEPRLRGSILVPVDDTDLAVREIERLAPDGRFVQVLLLVMHERPLGHRAYWPIYAAAERHGLAVAVHAGSHYRHAPGSGGWTTYQVEDHVQHSFAFENTLVSFLAEGVFQKFPALKLVFLESGFAWLPTLLWRCDKTWRGTRAEVPWLDRPPSEILRGRLFLGLRPCDPPGPAELSAVLRHLAPAGGTDLLLFSTDFPHRHFEGDAALPAGLPEESLPAILSGNAARACPRLAPAPVETS
ncbi:amidohydrolase family protein [Oceanicella sp. SM1341]|uniref:amidohydrolase family protein n=1 Tax=Oceanicella sp. SM1341 TaxID=1548889 RepID=UPI000E4E26D5|nr:amidohydrolase family protein [Oceanicella sp. SM1341]